jgi:hypothetical protein
MGYRRTNRYERGTFGRLLSLRLQVQEQPEMRHHRRVLRSEI